MASSKLFLKLVNSYLIRDAYGGYEIQHIRFPKFSTLFTSYWVNFSTKEYNTWLIEGKNGKESKRLANPFV